MAILTRCSCGHQFQVTSERETAVCPACGKVQFVNQPAPRAESAAPVGAIVPEHLKETMPYVSASQNTPPPATSQRSRQSLRNFGIVLLVFAAVLGIPTGLYLAQGRRAESLRDELRRIPQERQAAQEATLKAEQDQHMQLVVTGPGTLQAGAPNAYRIETKSLTNRPLPARLTVRLLDSAQKVVHEETDVESRGAHVLQLPAQLAHVSGTALTLEVLAKKQDASVAQSWLRERLSLEAPVYATHLATDKPMYRPSEVVSFRSLTLDRFGQRPPVEDLKLTYTITNGNGEKVFELQGADQLTESNKGFVLGPDRKPMRGVGAGDYAIPPRTRGGEYTLTVSEAQARFAPQQRKFIVNHYEKPRLHKELEWSRRSYGPGEKAAALCRVSRIEGGTSLANQPVSATVQIDGKHYQVDGTESAGAVLAGRTDASGAVQLVFSLPAQIERGEASLSVQFSDGGNIETLVRPIPIVVHKLLVDFYPEGGDLVAGVPNRVYLQARTLLDRAAEVKGRIMDRQGKTVAEVQTLNSTEVAGVNQGLGAFTFTPQAGEQYDLKISAPAGIEGRFPLPAVKVEGVGLHIPSGIVSGQEPIKVMLRNAGPARKLLVGAYARGRLVDHRDVEVKPAASAEVLLKPQGGQGGVLRITVFEKLGVDQRREQLRPMSERLIYRRPTERLHLQLTADHSRYLPGDIVRLQCAALNEQGQQAPAVVMLAVVDQGVLSLADEKTARTMPTHFLLTSELRRPEDMEHADFVLGDHPRAAEVLDLVLGTQGWRRFAEQDPEQFRKQHTNEADRLLATIGDAPIQTSNGVEVESACQAAFQQQWQKASTEIAGNETRLHQQIREAEAGMHKFESIAQNLATALLVAAVLSFFGVFLYFVIVGLQKTNNVQSGIVMFCAIFCVIVVVCIVSITALGTNASVTFQNVGSTIGAAKDGGGFAPPSFRGDAKSPAARSLDFTEKKAPTPAAAPSLPSAAPIELQADTKAPTSEMMTSQFFQLEDQKSAPDSRRYHEAERYARLRGSKKVATTSAARRFMLGDGKPPAGEAWPPLLIREYAHQRPPGVVGVRTDFTETVYWHPVLVLPDGKSTVTFTLSAAVTRFHTTAYGHTLDGRIGAASTMIESRLPFSIEPKMPIEVTSNDKIDLPVTIANDSDAPRAVTVRLQKTGLELLQGNDQEQLQLASNQRTRRVFRLQPTLKSGQAQVQIDGLGNPFSADSVRRSLTVVPDGFPVVGRWSDALKETAHQQVDLPERWFAGTLKCQVQVFPSLLSDIQTGLEGLLREPFG